MVAVSGWSSMVRSGPSGPIDALSSRNWGLTGSDRPLFRATMTTGPKGRRCSVPSLDAKFVVGWDVLLGRAGRAAKQGCGTLRGPSRPSRSSKQNEGRMAGLAGGSGARSSHGAGGLPVRMLAPNVRFDGRVAKGLPRPVEGDDVSLTERSRSGDSFCLKSSGKWGRTYS